MDVSVKKYADAEDLLARVRDLEEECNALRQENESFREHRVSTEDLLAIEERAQDSNSALRLILDSSPFGVSIISRNNPDRRLFVNQRMAELFGFESSEDMLNFSATDSYVNPEDIEKIRRPSLEGAFQTEATVERYRKDGTRWWCEFSRRTGRFEGEEVIIAWHADITARKEAEMAFAENSAKLQAVFDNSPLNMNLKDTTGRYQLINKMYADWYGLTPDDICGKHASEFGFDAPVTAETDKVERAVLETGEPSQYEVQIKGKDGEFFDRQVIKFPVKTAEGEINSIGTIAIDITDHKKIERHLMEAKESAERANNAKSEFLSSMSHELRTPLHAVLGFSQMLQLNADEPLSNFQKNCVDHISTGGNHLLGLIDQVLELARIEAGELSLHLEEVSLRDVCGECLELLDKSAEDHEISVSLDVDSSWRIMADHIRLKQVLLNLLTNAVKYSQTKGNIKVAAELVGGDLLRVSVADDGPGISSDKQSGLFEPFNRLGQEAGEVEGTGIGLTITKQLVEAMGGEIGYDSQVGSGSTFWVEFSVEDQAEIGQITTADGSKDTTVQVSETAEATMLYIENTPANLHLMRAIVEKTSGLSLISAHNAEIGLAMAVKQRPDLILMDINLPGMDGVAAMRELHAKAETRDIPVIAISASAMKRDIDRTMAAGFRAYVTKPFNVPELVNLIEKELAT